MPSILERLKKSMFKTSPAEPQQIVEIEQPAPEPAPPRKPGLERPDEARGWARGVYNIYECLWSQAAGLPTDHLDIADTKSYQHVSRAMELAGVIRFEDRIHRGNATPSHSMFISRAPVPGPLFEHQHLLFLLDQVMHPMLIERAENGAEHYSETEELLNKIVDADAQSLRRALLSGDERAIRLEELAQTWTIKHAQAAWLRGAIVPLWNALVADGEIVCVRTPCKDQFGFDEVRERFMLPQFVNPQAAPEPKLDVAPPPSAAKVEPSAA